LHCLLAFQKTKRSRKDRVTLTCKGSAYFLGQKRLKLLDPQFVTERKIGEDDRLFLLECCALLFSQPHQRFRDVDITKALSANFGRAGFTMSTNQSKWNLKVLHAGPQFHGSASLLSLVQAGALFVRTFAPVTDLKEPAVKMRLDRLVQEHKLDEPGCDFHADGIWYAPVLPRSTSRRPQQPRKQKPKKQPDQNQSQDDEVRGFLFVCVHKGSRFFCFVVSVCDHLPVLCPTSVS
jgi:hypothetical protein